MISLIIGGSGSGKSEYAEKLVTSLSGKRIYIATMQPWDDECKARIKKHQSQRANRNFETIECYNNLNNLNLPYNSNVLLECMGNLVANEIYSPNREEIDSILEDVKTLINSVQNITIVTNEVFSSGTNYSEETVLYLKILAEINNKLAELADNVVEVICGLPNFIKGVPL